MSVLGREFSHLEEGAPGLITVGILMVTRSESMAGSGGVRTGTSGGPCGAFRRGKGIAACARGRRAAGVDGVKVTLQATKQVSGNVILLVEVVRVRTAGPSPGRSEMAGYATVGCAAPAPPPICCHARNRA